MRISNHANLSPDRLAEVERDVPEHSALADVVRWGLTKASGAASPQVVAEIVTQDEFNHDAIVPWREGLTLVYGVT